MSHGIRQMLTYQGESSQIQAYLARPETGDPRPAVLVIHEIYGLTEHIQDVANRFAKQGYVALAPHLYSRQELAETLTASSVEEAVKFRMSLPREKLNDQAYIAQAMAGLKADKRREIKKTLPVLFGGLPREKMIQDLILAVEFLNAQAFVRPGLVTSLGFCFGGG